MGEEMRQCLDRDRFEKDHCERDRCERDRCEKERCEKDFKRECECRDNDDCGFDWDFGGWLPILIIIFLLCGGTNILGGLGGFGGNSCKDDCNDGGFGGSWILIIIVIFFLFNNQKDGKGGFLGGLF